jgi:hypothetical protein
MIQDGWGYGKSSYWPYVAKSVAIDEHEECDHLEEKTLIVRIRYIYDPNKYNVRIKVRCPSCYKVLPKTSSIIQKKFLDFYGK